MFLGIGIHSGEAFRVSDAFDRSRRRLMGPIDELENIVAGRDGSQVTIYRLPPTKITRAGAADIQVTDFVTRSVGERHRPQGRTGPIRGPALDAKAQSESNGPRLNPQ